jgi:methionine-rich copper-binding protein CopC
VTDTFTYRVTDAAGNTSTATLAVSVTPVNDAPALTTTATARSYTENAAAIVANDDLSLSDVDSANLTRATVQITGGLTAGDVLSFTASDVIDGTYDPATGTLTLEGTATVAQYQTVLRSVSYSSTSDHPTATSASRTLTWQVNDGAATNNLSSSATSMIDVTSVNDAPTLANALIDTTATAGTAMTAYVVASNAFTDVDSTLTYTATLADGSELSTKGLSFNADTRTISGTPTTVGTISVKVTATDGSLSANDTFDIVVSPANSAPVSSDVDGVVADVFGAAVPITYTAGATSPTFTANNTYTMGATTVTVSGNTGTVLGTPDSFYVEPLEQVLYSFSKSVYAVQIKINDLSYNLGGNEHESAQLYVNGVAYSLTSANTSVVNASGGGALSPLFSADGKLLANTSVSNVNATVTLNASDFGNNITSVKMVYGNLLGGPTSGVGEKVTVTESVANGGNTAAQSVEALFGPTYTDADLDTMLGVVITSAGTTAEATAKGVYQYQKAGTSTWVNLAADLTDSTSVFLAANDLVRFVASSTNPSLFAKPDLVARLVDSSITAPATGAVVDVSGTKHGGSTAYSGDTVTLHVVPEVVAPTLLSSNPADNGYIATVASDLTLTFSEAVKAGTGLIELYNSSNVLVESFSVASSTKVTGWNTSTLTINPTANLAGAAGHYVKIAASAVTDLSGNAYAGITNATTLNFTTPNADGSYSAGPAYIETTTGDSTQLGFSVSSAGDVNGDGYQDMLVGARFENPNGTTNTYQGAVYVVYGNAAGTGTNINNGSIASSLGFKISGGTNPYRNLGTAVAGLGDINGDGLDDVLVSGSLPSSGAGEAYVVYGSKTSTNLDVSTIASTPSQGFKITGTDTLGWSAKGVGDINGDGIADMMVGSLNTGLNPNTYVIYGSNNATTLDLGSGSIAQDRGYLIKSDNPQDGSISGAGDVNGDGLADLIIGEYDNGGTKGGADVFVVYGTQGTTGTTLDVRGGTIASSLGFKITSGATGTDMGTNVTSAGDVNGDGLADIAFNTLNSVYVLYGTTSATSSALTLSSGINASQGYKITGPTTDGKLGDDSTWMSSVGDMNGDGLADILVGDAYYNKAAYVIYGNATGAAVNLSAGTIASSQGFKISLASGLTPANKLDTAGDINGDGLNDLIIGDNSQGKGAYYVVLGGTQNVTNAVTLTGTSSSEAVMGTSGNDVLTGNGGVDRFYAGKGDDTIVLNSTDVSNLANNVVGSTKAFVSGGTGFDTAQLTGGASLDLTTISNAGAVGLTLNSRVESIERIDMRTDTAANTLTIAAKDVADMADFNSIHTGTASDDGKTWTNVSGTALSATTKFHQVVVDGTSTDVVNLAVGNGYWTNVGEVNNGTTGYYVYQNTAMNSQVIVDKTVVVNNLDGSPAPGESVIDLGGSGKLIKPIQVGGNWFYYWDRSGDGTSTDAGTANGGLDYTTHDVLDTIFNKDINGVVNTVDANADGSFGTTSVYRYGTINGVDVALPAFGTSTDLNSYSGLYSQASTPSGWATNRAYWVADETVAGHGRYYLANGTTDGTTDANNGWVAVQVVKANAAPVLNAAQSPTLTSVSAGAGVPTGAVGDLVSTLVSGISDADSGASKGIAITGVHAGATLYYSTNGGTTWTAASGLSDTNALLLAADSDTRVYYKANGATGTFSDAITFRAWDQTQHAAEGVYADTTSRGGKAEFSTATDTVAVTSTVNPGDTVIDLGTGNGKLIKPVQVEGKWYYFWDKSGDGIVSGDSATHDALDAIFKYDINGNLNPVAGTNTNDVYRYATLNGVQVALPTINGSITGYAKESTQTGTAATIGGNSVPFDEWLAIWDTQNGTGTTAGGTTVSTATGWANSSYWTASTAWSGIEYHTGVELATGYVYDPSAQYTGDQYTAYVAMQVVNANAAPVLDAAQSPTLTAVSASAAAPSGAVGDLVSTLVGGITDGDAGSTKGIAITGVHAGATLKYSVNGGTTWLTATSVSDTNALLLAADSNTRVYYQANGTSGTFTDAITFRAWDMTQHITEGVYVNTSINGGKAEFSTATDTVAVTSTVTPGDSVIDLGTSGKLIAPVMVNNKYYYYWDLSGNGSANNTNNGILDGGDNMSHNYLDTIFCYDINGVKNTTVQNPDGNYGTTDVYRYGTINGVKMALVIAGTTQKDFYPTGTSVSLNATTANPTFGDSLLGIWDAYNGTGTSGTGVPPNWVNNGYWAATPYSTTGHMVMTGSGTIFAIDDTNIGYNAAVQVLPVVIDLNRDGILSYGQVTMDVNGDGHLDTTKWAGAQDGVLVWDKFADGLVHNNSQYAFGQYATTYRTDALGHARAATDLEGLADAFDSNHDGVFNAADAQFGEFKVWQDANQNGVSEAGEVRSLADLGIESIKLTSDGVVRTPAEGVNEAGQTTATATDGSSVLVSDAGFAYSALAYSMNGDQLSLLGAEMKLDLSSIVATHNDVAAVDLTGTGANSLKLNLSDVLGTAATNGVHKLTLTGDANDSVDLNMNEWANTGTTVTEGNHSYALYYANGSTAAQLLIDQHMQITQVI